MEGIVYLVSALLLIVTVVVISMLRRHRRAEFIRTFRFPDGLFAKLKARHPHLTQKDCHLVTQGLRQFFLSYLKSDRQFVSMPSQVVDDLWHEFILYTKAYHGFCKQAFGRFMHHTPAVVLSSDHGTNTGSRRCFWQSCKAENIDPNNPSRLPLLFALDEKLRIPAGFHYKANCDSLRTLAGATAGTTVIHCGGDFASISFDGTIDGFGDGGDGGSDGGGGCGGD